MIFAETAARLAGLAGAVLGWSPDQFWGATPSELAAVLKALLPEAPPPMSHIIDQLKEQFPDG